MKKLRLLWLPLVAAFVVACGGSGSGDSANQQAELAALQVHKQGAGVGSVTSSPVGIDCGTQCDSVYRIGTAVTLNAAPAGNSSFSGWAGSGTSCSGTGACTVTLETAKTVTATFSQPQSTKYNLGISVAGQGAVTSNVGSINCTGDCSASFDSGTSVTLTATPASGYTFSGWSGTGISCSGTVPCAVAMSADRTVTATFAAVVPQYTLTVTGAGAMGSVSSAPSGITCPTTCAKAYNAGTVVTLTASPATGYQFSGWSNACSGTNTCVVTMSAARTAAASFTAVAANKFALNLAVTGSGTVTSAPAGITCPTACSTTFDSGTVVTLTAAPATGYKFSKWTGGSCAAVTGPCSVTMSAVTSVSAEFLPITYSLAVTKQGTGTVSSQPAGIACGATCSYSFNTGTAVTLSAVPSAGYSFTGWSNNSNCSGTSNCIITLSGGASVTATFTATYALSLTNGTGGSVSSSPSGISCASGSTCNATYNTGTSITLTATPATGYTFSAWGGACTGSTNTCTVAMSQARSVTTTYTVSTPTDTTPPTVSQIAPAGSATNVLVTSPVTVTFSEAVNCSTVTTTSFTVGAAAGAVSCTGSTAVFTPTAALAYATPYAVQLSTTIKDLAGNALGGTRSWSFTTASAPATGSAFTFLAYGDSRAGTICDANNVHMGLVAKMAAEPADFVFNVGDMVAGLDSTTNWVQRGTCPADSSRGSLKEIIAPLQGKTPAAGLPTFYFPVVGNHDDGWGDGWYPDKFGNGFCDVFTPSSFIPNHTQSHAYFADWKSSSVTHYADTQFYSLMCDKTTANANKVYSQYMYYSFDYKNSHFAVMRLNSDYVDLMECGGGCSDQSNYDMYYNKHQLDWLRYDLAQANARGVQNIFVLTHAPLLTTSDGHAANASWPTLLKEFSSDKVKIVFSGHAHVYERSYPVTATTATPGGARDDTNGTVYTVTGGGGSYPDGFSRTSTLSAVRASGTSAYHYLRIDVNGTAITVKAIGLDGTVIDSYTR